MSKQLAIFFFLTTLIVYALGFVSVSFAQTTERSSKFSLDITPSIGYSHGNLSYSIAGNEQGTDPNVLSELKWTNLKAINYFLGLRGHIFSDKLLYKVHYHRNDILGGEVSDIDYADDNRQGVFSEQYLSSHKGFLTQFQLKIGYTILTKDRFSLSSFFGFDNMHQRAYVLNHKGDNADNNPLGYFEGLDSYYDTRWRSIGVSLLTNYSFTDRFSAHADAGMYISWLNGFGNWNLIPDFAHPKSYTHQGTGYRFIGDLSLTYEVHNRSAIGAGYNFNYATIRDGRDVLYLQSGETYRTKLNEVNSVGGRVYLKYIYSLFQ